MLTNKSVALSFILSILFAGCADVDDAAYFHVQCGCGQAKEALILNNGADEMSEDRMTLEGACSSLAKELAGRWTGIGDASDRRIVMDDDGLYKIFEKRGSKWVCIQKGKYWVEYDSFDGVMRSELHMTIPDTEDYVVRYYLTENELHLEEPTDGEPEMVFEKTN